MPYTSFGELLRILRIKNHEVMGDIADLLGVKTPFLSAVETGKRNVPESWVDILADHYSMSDVEKQEMIDAIADSKTQVKINLTDSEPYKRKMALQFQRSFENMDEETAKRIISLLNRNQEDN